MLASLLEALIREVLIQAFFFRGEPLKENEVFLGKREAGMPSWRDATGCVWFELFKYLEATLRGVVPETNRLELKVTRLSKIKFVGIHQYLSIASDFFRRDCPALEA
jgi:hypothetical protein